MQHLSELLALFGTLIVVCVSYLFTKWREREAEWRKTKLEHYIFFTEALSGRLNGESTAETQRIFANACNKLNLVAPQAVLQALQAFHQQERSNELHVLLSMLFYEIRKDLKISPADVKTSFAVQLWASGMPSNAAKKRRP